MALASATCDRALSPGGAPDWVHLFPDGRMTGRDGREFDLDDPAALVLAFQASGVDLPVDYEHQNDNPDARLKGPVPAAGWIKELRADDTGLWGRVEWTATARELIGNREYRYLSPSFLYYIKTGAIAKLKGAGLVHNPNLHLAALARQDTAMPPDPMTNPKPAPSSAVPSLPGLLHLLGLAPDAAPVAVLRAVLDLITGGAAGAEAAAVMAELAPSRVPDPARFVPVETVQAMLAERNLTLATMSEARATEKVGDAVRRGYLSPAMKPWAMALCRNDEASFDAFVQTSIPPFAHLLKPPADHMRAPPDFEHRPVIGSDAAEAICAQLGLPPGSLRERG